MTAAPNPSSSGTSGLRHALREHWLTGIHCDHDTKTDTATCYCTIWRSEPMPTVGAALDAWIDHLLEHIPALAQAAPIPRDLTSAALKTGIDWYQHAQRPDDIAATVTLIWAVIWDHYSSVPSTDRGGK